MKGRVIAQRLPICPGHDSRFTIHHHKTLAGAPWWIYYDDDPADLPHADLVAVVNDLKRQEGQLEGGSFSINEHGQIIARTNAPIGPGQGNSVHLVGVVGGSVYSYNTPITFRHGALDPTAEPEEGDPWPGPLCGMSYTLAAPGYGKLPSRMHDEVTVKVEGQTLALSMDASISPYPPTSGPLALFLQALRRCLPDGGRFRVNEHARAFTSDDEVYVGRVPLKHWFRPLHSRS